MTPKFVVGIDGGGTKTLTELYDGAGRVLASARGGPSNFQVIGEKEAAQAILHAVRTCLDRSRIPVKRLHAIVAGLSGAGRRGDQLRMIWALKKFAPRFKIHSHHIRVLSDARTALEGAFSGKPGIIVIAGTGSIVFGKNEDGEIQRAGGWGRVIGDEGSGYSIGREAFRALAKIIDGREKNSRLVRLFDRDYRLMTQQQIIRAIYKKNFDIASVVPTVLEAAEQHDACAMRILHYAADELVDVIAVVAKKMKPNGKRRLPLAFVGSLLSNDNMYSRIVPRKISARLKWVDVVPPEGSPMRGAGIIGSAI